MVNPTIGWVGRAPENPAGVVRDLFVILLVIVIIVGAATGNILLVALSGLAFVVTLTARVSTRISSGSSTATSSAWRCAEFPFQDQTAFRFVFTPRAFPRLHGRCNQERHRAYPRRPGR